MSSWRLNPYEAKARLSERQGQAETRRQRPTEAQAGSQGQGRRVGTRPGMETWPEGRVGGWHCWLLWLSCRGSGSGGKEVGGAHPVHSVPHD